MKKIILVAVLFATVLTSCSSSDQENLIEKSYTISVKKACDSKEKTTHFVSKKQYYEVKEEIKQNSTPCYSIGFKNLEKETITGYYSGSGITISE